MEADDGAFVEWVRSVLVQYKLRVDCAQFAEFQFDIHLIQVLIVSFGSGHFGVDLQEIAQLTIGDGFELQGKQGTIGGGQALEGIPAGGNHTLSCAAYTDVFLTSQPVYDVGKLQHAWVKFEGELVPFQFGQVGCGKCYFVSIACFQVLIEGFHFEAAAHAAWYGYGI